MRARGEQINATRIIFHSIKDTEVSKSKSASELLRCFICVNIKYNYIRKMVHRCIVKLQTLSFYYCLALYQPICLFWRQLVHLTMIFTYIFCMSVYSIEHKCTPPHTNVLSWTNSDWQHNCMFESFPMCHSIQSQ